MHFLGFYRTPSNYSAKWVNCLSVDYISGNALKTKQSRKPNQWAVSKRRGTKAKQRLVGSNRTLVPPPHLPQSLQLRSYLDLFPRRVARAHLPTFSLTCESQRLPGYCRPKEVRPGLCTGLDVMSSVVTFAAPRTSTVKV